MINRHSGKRTSWFWQSCSMSSIQTAKNNRGLDVNTDYRLPEYNLTNFDQAKSIQVIQGGSFNFNAKSCIFAKVTHLTK